MLSKDEFERARERTLEYFEKAGIVLSKTEKLNIEVADFGLGDLYSVNAGRNLTMSAGRKLIIVAG